jgi:hypothetical protein
MADNIDQHFNPKFYLRNFAADKKRKSIRLFNIASAMYVPRASIKAQCARPYYYGKDLKLEKGLGLLETAVAPLFRRMIVDLKLPARRTPDHGLLGQFIAVQHARTQAHEMQTNELADKFGKLMVRPRLEPKLAEALDRFNITMVNAPAWSVQSAAVRAPILFDLEYKLLVAPPGSFFFAADNPVVLLNQFIDTGPARIARKAASDTPLGSRGYASRGLQIWLPISPGVGLFWYDHDIYRVGPVGRSVIEVTKKDVDHLNALQFINAHENVYFADEKQAEYLRQIARTYGRYRHESFGKFEVNKPRRENGRMVRQIVFGPLDPKYAPVLGFSKTKRRIDKTPRPGVRDPAIVQIVKDFADAIEKRGAPLEFGAFIEKHPLARHIRPI